MIFVAWSAGFARFLHKARQSKNEVLRLAAAGSVMTQISELSFYCLDTINSRSKISTESISMMRMLRNVINEEGATALFRGIAATYYGSMFYGFTYFFSYPWLKKKGHDFFSSRNALPLLHLGSGFVSEYLALLLYYPFETIKVRLQTKTYADSVSLIDGIADLARETGLKQMYKGYFWYALHYSINYSVQISLYEYLIATHKRLYPEKYYAGETKFIVPTAFVCGMVGSSLSNPVEVIAVRKQISPELALSSILNQNESLRQLMTKGLGARVVYHSTQSVVVFFLIHHIGKFFNVDLTEVA